MKITIFSDNVAPYRIAWAEALGKTNDVTFAYVKSEDSERNSDWLVKYSKIVNMVKLPSGIIRNHAVTLNVIRYIKKHPADIVIFDGYGTIPNMLGIMYMKYHKKRHFINIDGLNLSAKDSRAKNWLKKLTFSEYAYFLCGSELSQKWICSLGMKNNHTIVHNFSSIHDYEVLDKAPSKEERNKMKQKLGLLSKPTVLAVGRFLALKQFDLLIEAFKNLDNKYQLLIIGEGEEKGTYLNLIQKYNLQNVLILDFMAYDALKNYYLAADVLVLPSNSEVWGLVINEGMGCGALPVITTDRCVAGYSLVENGVNGFRFEYNNVRDLEKKIEAVLESDRKIGEESLRIIRDYTIEGIARTHLEWFKSLGY